jgi:hypothetical protein
VIQRKPDPAAWRRLGQSLNVEVLGFLRPNHGVLTEMASASAGGSNDIP